MPVTRSVSQATPSTPPNSTIKRVRSPESAINNPSKPNKKSKTTKMSAKEFEELKNMIGSLSSTVNQIGQKIDDTRLVLENKFTDLASQVNNDVQALQTSVTEFQTKITSDMDAINLTLKNHADRLDNNEDDVQRVQLSQDVRLVGFAVKENENLIEIYRKVAEEIGFATTDNIGVPTIERLSTKNHTTGQIMLSPTILIHFTSLRQKQIFYSLYLNKMPLNPVKFGLAAENRIVVGENLTRKNALLFRSAQILRKDGKIAQTFTENGIVKVRFAKGKNAKTFTIRSNIDLDTVVAQNAVLQTQTQPLNNGMANTTASTSQNTPLANDTTNSRPVTITVQQMEFLLSLQRQQQEQQQQEQLRQMQQQHNTNSIQSVTGLPQQQQTHNIAATSGMNNSVQQNMQHINMEI